MHLDKLLQLNTNRYLSYNGLIGTEIFYCCKSEVPGISAAEISCTISWKLLVPNEEKAGVDGVGTGKVKSSDDESEQLDVASVRTSFGIELDAPELELMITFISEIWFAMQCTILSHTRSDWYYQNKEQVNIRCCSCTVSVKSASPFNFSKICDCIPRNCNPLHLSAW